MLGYFNCILFWLKTDPIPFDNFKVTLFGTHVIRHHCLDIIHMSEIEVKLYTLALPFGLFVVVLFSLFAFCFCFWLLLLIFFFFFGGGVAIFGLLWL